MRIIFFIAIKHLLARKRQSIVSLLGIILGVAFFLAISSLMQGSQNDFIKRLVDNSPHITVSDEFRDPRVQPAHKLYPDAAVEIRSLRPVTEIRGIRGYKQKLKYIKNLEGLKASPSLSGNALINISGKPFAANITGIIPKDFSTISTLEDYMIRGGLDNLTYNKNGILIGKNMAKRLSVDYGDNLSISSTAGQNRTFKIVGLFHTGNRGTDYYTGFVNLKPMQALLNRPNRVNAIALKLTDPYKALALSKKIEEQVSYKTESWQEKSEDLMKTLMIRNIIMYSVVSAVLIVAAFGIYNVISTVVMEKQKDISILKSMGFLARDIQKVFLIQGVILGSIGCITGIPLGMGLMYSLMQVKFKPPGYGDMMNMPIDWSLPQFFIAAAFAILAATLAALLPARKASKVKPVDILRGG